MPSLAELLKGKKFQTPFLKEQYIAQQIAALPIDKGGLGLSAMNTPEERAAGMAKYVFPYLHGTDRLDRLLSKKYLDPKRATSGPMPYGTNDPAIASNYAASKADTSMLLGDEDRGMSDFFQVSPKSLGMRGTTPYTVEQSYHYLTPEKRKELLENYYRVGYEDPEEATGKFVLHPPGENKSIASRDHLEYILKREGKGNPLSALRSLWGESGELYDNPEALADIYKTAGYPHEILQENAPWFSAKGVFSGKVLSDNPLFTSDVDNLKTLVPQLEQAFAKDRTKLADFGADMWDKNTRYTPKQWVEQLKQDLSSGENSYVWTSIPDKVTKQLKAMGYDTIVDQGGKMGGQGHEVVIPFEPHQVRAFTAAFNPAKKYEANLLASHPVANALGLTGLAKILESGKDVDLRQSINDYLSEGYDPAGLEKLTGVAPPTKKGDIVKEALMATDIGAPLSLAEMMDALQRGDYKGAALSSLGAIPMVGAIKASHGSPHLFDKFDMSKIGTGEGAQAYGHGLYYAQGFDSPVAQQYREALSGGAKKAVNASFSEDPELWAAGQLHSGINPKDIADGLSLLGYKGNPNELIQSAQNRLKNELDAGHLYNVSLEWPNADRETADPLGEHHLLDWDKRLSEQSDFVKNAFAKSDYARGILQGNKKILDPNDKYTRGEEAYSALVNAMNEGYVKRAGSYLHGAAVPTSEHLRDIGIPGLKYLDQGSRNAQKGTFNYVIFDQDIPKIISRNGVSLTDLLRR